MYRIGDTVQGEILKDGEHITFVKAGGVGRSEQLSTPEEEVLQFDVAVQGDLPLEGGDRCTLVTDEGESEVEYLHGIRIGPATMAMFRFI